MKLLMRARAASGLLFVSFIVGATAASAHQRREYASAEHVLLLIVDGMHQFDLKNYVVSHPASACDPYRPICVPRLRRILASYLMAPIRT